MRNIELTIVTISYNCENDILLTLQSVEKQFKYIDCNKLEYIVIDGKSSDSTVEVAKKKLDIFSNFGVLTKIVSEPDNGIYDAMNKGIETANGKYINMLNAGDIYENDKVLFNVINYIESNDVDIIYGNTIRKNKYISEEWKVGNIEEVKDRMIFCHQSVFIKRNLEEHKYNIEYKYCADYDLILRLYLNSRKFGYINENIVIYSLDGVTGNKSMIKAYKEIYKIRLKNGVSNNNLATNIKYYIGLFKRKIIIIVPDKYRWKITKFLNIFRKKRKY